MTSGRARTLAAIGLFLGTVHGSPAVAGGIPFGIVDVGRSAEKLRTVVSGASTPVLVFSEEDYVRHLLVDNAARPPVRFTQVVPLETGIGEGPFQGWRSTLPEPYRNVDSFGLHNGVIRGKAGIDNVVVTGLDRPSLWPPGPVLWIDSGFFPPLYKDEVRTPMVSLVLKLYATLLRARVSPVRAWIVDGTMRRDFPLEFGYIPDLLADVFSDPDRFRDELPEKWRRLEAAQKLAFFGQMEEALTELDSLAREGGGPSCHYQAATIRLREGDVEGGIRSLSKAAKGNPPYVRGFLFQAGVFWNGGELGTAEVILRAGRELFPEDDRFATGIARLLVQRAVHVKEADPEAARKLFEEAVSLPSPPGVREEIVKIWSETGAFQGPVAPRGQTAPGRP